MFIAKKLINCNLISIICETSTISGLVIGTMLTFVRLCKGPFKYYVISGVGEWGRPNDYVMT